jgi:hypothetical protein
VDGVGAASVAGPATCDNGADEGGGCGQSGVGAASVLGPASCDGGEYGCGHGLGAGAVSVAGDASCANACGSLADGMGLGAVSVLGHAACAQPFDARDAAGAQQASCLGGRDVARQLGAPV